MGHIHVVCLWLEGSKEGEAEKWSNYLQPTLKKNHFNVVQLIFSTVIVSKAGGGQLDNDGPVSALLQAPKQDTNP